MSEPHYLLLQLREPNDAMLEHEQSCFADALRAAPARFHAWNLLLGDVDRALLDRADLVLIGGSPKSVVTGGPWLGRVLALVEELIARKKPTFGVCFGFQVIAKALGGEVVRDLARSEIGTVDVALSAHGLRDPVFAPLGAVFAGQMGHEDVVVRLPETAVSLASSARVPHEALRVRGAPVYATQFHPEMDERRLHERLGRYPQFVRRLAGAPFEEFAPAGIRPSPQTDALLPRFAALAAATAVAR
ncbi:MAG: glutamine amidotransferase [Candidatus Eremiobacteraeota bacterium]|nr:glutamine amidotransferase [Candidatus Eremiobacteraeota bacterium]